MTTLYQGRWLRTVLQPIFSVRHQRPIGCEALIRGQDEAGNQVPAWKIFADQSECDALELDRLCAGLHARSFSAIAGERNWLFLNLNPAQFSQRVWNDGFFVDLLAGCSLKPHQLVFEVLESPVSDHVDLAPVIQGFRDLGALVALDDFGAGHSNFERIWRLRPDIVKLDRSLMVFAEQDRAMRRSLPSIVDILHQNGCLVVAEGIENERQALNAIDAGVDLVQGYFFAMPFEINEQFLKRTVDWERLEQGLENTAGGGTIAIRDKLVSHIARMYELAGRVDTEPDLALAAQRMFELPDVIRCYTIDEQGRQRDSNVNSPKMAHRTDQRLAPLASAEGASWISRPYFRRAKANPGEVHITHEYLSCADGAMCITLSISVNTRRGRKIICADLLAD